MAIAAGITAPNFTAQDDTGNTVSLSAFEGQTVVIYFYPKDDTPGCTKQACSFRDAYSEYQDKDIVVLGVSMDDETSHQAFKDKFNLPFPLIVDTDGTIARAYEVEGGGYAKRVTFVIDGKGVVTKVYESINTETHATDILSDLDL
ncbi:MAG: peroxiredoxin [Phormidesmis sp. RL_2_1]|nr:peroxiredoxin [Phormidesmis sp. RL_2_1]